MKTLLHFFIASLLITQTGFITVHAQINLKTHQLKVSFDDDYWNYRAKVTDHYYSSGVTIEYAYKSKNSASLLNRHLGLFSQSAHTIQSVGFTQLIFTPTNTLTTQVKDMDYPYAGILQLNYAISSTNANASERLTSQIHIGLVGQHSFGMQTQTFVHRLTHSIKPQGWNKQINSQMDVGYLLNYEKHIFSPVPQLQTIGFVQMNAGTFFNNLSMGTNLWFSGTGSSYFHQVGTIRTSNRKEKTKDLNLSLNFKPSLKLVLSNGVLQNGTFNVNYYQPTLSENDHFESAQLNRLLLECSFGIFLEYKQCMISFTQKIQSAEFTGLNHQEYGNLTIQVGL